MAAAKTERLMNLTICLLSTTRYLSKTEIRSYVTVYSESGEQAFERMFERDKEELRELGVPIETGSNDHYFDDEQGYRIRPGDFELPPIELTVEEAAVLGMAGRAWQEVSLAAQTRSALAKLRAAGVEVDSQRLRALELEPVVTVREAGFGVWYDAVIDRTPVTFDYTDRGTRTLHPWGLTSHRGRWYVVGWDVDRDAVRMFRLSRVIGEPRLSGRPGSFTVPADTDLRQLVRALDPDPVTQLATIGIRPDRAAGLRRRGTVSADGEAPPGFVSYDVGYSSRRALVDELASYGADVVVLDPPDLRQGVIAHLEAWIARPHLGRSPS